MSTSLIRDRLMRTSKPPKMPPMVETIFGTRVPASIPNAQKGWVFTGSDKDDINVNWYREGDLIPDNLIQPSVYDRLYEEQKGSPRFLLNHHGTYLDSGRPTSMPQNQELWHTLASQGIGPSGSQKDGDEELLPPSPTEAYNMWMQKRADGSLPQDPNPSSFPKSNNPFARMPNSFNPFSFSSQNKPLSGVVRLDGSQVSPEEMQEVNQWGRQNLANMQKEQMAVNIPPKLGTGTNPMTIDNMPGATPPTTPPQNMNAGTFASRAMPMMHLALQAYSLIQNSKSQKEQERFEQNQKAGMT